MDGAEHSADMVQCCARSFADKDVGDSFRRALTRIWALRGRDRSRHTRPEKDCPVLAGSPHVFRILDTNISEHYGLAYGENIQRT